ncbi:MAG: hypothetical protein M1815_004715 [Lichina confinis]|nr:MAG: hypothetical protein M1815_004715 [Lichina confinis]
MSKSALARGVATLVVGASLASVGLAQTFRRLGACPKLGCIFPPDQVDFLAGSFFDIRLEVHAPVNGSEASPDIGGVPDSDFTFTIGKKGEEPQDASAYFKVDEPELETWNFTWFEDLFARDAETPSLVQVAAKAYRKVVLYEPGEYVATLSYYDGSKTEATWLVRDEGQKRKAKNVILFIGDGMTSAMITAARLIAHQTINGKYTSKLQMDKFPVVGHQMSHSLDSFITDSANSATALYSGRKASVNALNVYGDSSRSPADDPKFETISEIWRRLLGGAIGIVSTAYIADATPAALSAHTRLRGQLGAVVDSYLNGVTNYSWVPPVEPDVIFGGGAEQFLPGPKSFQGRDYYAAFEEKGYNVVLNKTALEATADGQPTLGIFSVDNLSTWLDRNVYTDSLRNQSNSPDGSGGDATDQPGLKEMTVKAVEILHKRGGSDGFFLMSEAASIDKQMHLLDYDRALGDLLELDDTIRATIDKLTELGELEDTLIVVTADHGHGFDVMGSVDTKYMDEQETDRDKRNAIGTYFNSGLSQYVQPTNGSSVRYTDGTAFPANWDPRYTLYQGVGAFPDHREDYRVNKDGPREPAINVTEKLDYTANPEDSPTGFLINGTLPVEDDVGVHSLTDVPVFSRGPCQEYFGGVYDNTEIFFQMAKCLGLSRTSEHD